MNTDVVLPHPVPPHSAIAELVRAVRELDDVVAAVFSLSSSTPHLFGERRAEFEARLRELLRGASGNGVFSERAREVVIDLWEP